MNVIINLCKIMCLWLQWSNYCAIVLQIMQYLLQMAIRLKLNKTGFKIALKIGFETVFVIMFVMAVNVRIPNDRIQTMPKFERKVIWISGNCLVF